MRRKNTSLRKSYVLMVILPIFFFGIIVMWFSYNRFTKVVYAQLEDEMKKTVNIFMSMYEEDHRGDYSVISANNISALKKGDEYVANDMELFEILKKKTGYDLSFFYGEIRYVTTICTDSGEYRTGSTVSYTIRNQVYEKETEHFYNDVRIEEEKFAGYYVPLHNSDGKTVGMLELIAPSADIKRTVLNAVWPVILITGLLMLLTGAVAFSYAKNIVDSFKKISKFLKAVEKGNLSGELDGKIRIRNDEIGQMGNAAVNMQKSIRKLIERDALTDLYNRRYGDLGLRKVLARIEEEGTDACVCLGDIDFFKKFNDIYGHELGDIVLKSVADILKKCMAGNGFVARWGGEEFLLVYECDIAAAESKLQQVLESVNKLEIEYEGAILHINMSFGVVPANVDGKISQVDEALNRADNMLYYAKEHGRNQVVAEK